MKHILLLIALLVTMALASYQSVVVAQDGGSSSSEVLTNDSVITMMKAGLSSTIIASKIRASKTKFDVSMEELIRLKQAQVPDDVVNAMVEASANGSGLTSRTTAEVVRADPNDPLSLHEAGIYLFEEKTERRS